MLRLQVFMLEGILVSKLRLERSAKNVHNFSNQAICDSFVDVSPKLLVSPFP